MSVVDNRVVVACAGSGKTTKLIARLMSLLKRGATPGEILIITFTNKAAAEIRDRLLAKLEEEARGDSKLAALRRRILLSASTADTLSVHTFHGWFLTLLRHRPGGFFNPPNVCASADAVFDESWRRWQKRAEDAPSPALKTVLRELTPAAVRKMCGQFKEQRAAYFWREESSADAVCDSEHETAAADSEDAIEMRLRVSAAAFAQDISGGGKTVAAAQSAAARLATAQTGAAEEIKYFLTANDSIRAVLKTHAAKIGCTALLQELATALSDFLIREEQQRADEFNAAALQVCEDFNSEWDAVLRTRNEMTFDDLEFRVCEMMYGDNVYDALSYRLSTRYHHILIDEFQDTGPMQWQIVRKWLLDANGEEAPSVFIVGDPKQAIYGFRRGDSRLLHKAESFLQEYYRAQNTAPENTCYRCGENILKFVNAVFDDEVLPGFLAHKGGAANTGGRVEWHVCKSAAKSPRLEHIRNPLRDPPPAAAETQKGRAAAIAAKTAEILREWEIKKDGQTQRCTPEDILILMPQLTHAAALTDALSAENISCAVAGGGGSFLDSFECADILDLIAVLLSPERDYSLARILKSPLFALSDDALSDVVAGEGATLWEKLQRHSAASSRRARVLLKFWRRRAETTLLPAHDFLSRLFAQGDVFARYRAASPPPLRLRIGENLSRLLDLSLQIEGGARPLLSQFLDEARRLGADGGRNLKQFDSSPSAVRLMSIHAAKGLESPIVILADTDFLRSGGRGDGTDIFVDWPPGDAKAKSFVVALRRHRRANASFKTERETRAEKERMNLLYVAVTRAKQALVVFSPPVPKDVAVRAYRAMQELSPGQDAETKMVFGDDMCAAVGESPQTESSAISRPVRIGKREPQTAAAVRGEIRHQIVALLVAGVSRETARLLVAAEDAQWREAEKMATSSSLQRLLKNAAEVLTERDFFVDGEILRPDLIVVRDEAVWIVDYKTGDASPARHRPQLENYRRAIAAHYPARPIHLAVLDIHGQMHCLDSE